MDFAIYHQFLNSFSENEMTKWKHLTLKKTTLDTCKKIIIGIPIHILYDILFISRLTQQLYANFLKTLEFSSIIPAVAANNGADMKNRYSI